MKKPNASTVRAISQVIDYNVMTQAIANAALSRRAALQIEVAVSLIHFTQESGGTDTIGKAALKSVYNDAGYTCLAKADRDYKTVNRRLNAMSKLFDKLGSSLVYSWMADKGDTESIINYVVTEVAVYGFDTMDDVLLYVGAETNKTRAARQPVAAPVTVTTSAPEADDDAEEGQAPAETRFDLDAAYMAIVANYGAEEIRQFCTRILTHVAALELAMEPAPAPAPAPVDLTDAQAEAIDKSLAESTAALAAFKAPAPAVTVVKIDRKAQRQLKADKKASEQAARWTKLQADGAALAASMARSA